MILSEKLTWDFLNQENSSLGNFFLDISFQSGKIVLMKTYLVSRRTKYNVLKGISMDKPMLVFKRFGHQIHLMVQKEAKRCGIEFMGGPQGQVVRFLDSREKNQDLVLIKDIEQELNITKSVASNLVKRMVQNGLVELEASPSDKRAKFVHLTDKARSQMKQVKAFFERIDKQLMEDIDEDELLIFEKVLGQLQANIKGIGGENEEISQTN